MNEDRPIKITARNIIGAIIFTIGALLILGAIGNSDYAAECGKKLTASEEQEAVVHTIIGFVGCVVAFPIGGPMYYNDEESEVKSNGKRENQGQAEETVRAGEARQSRRERSCSGSPRQAP